MNPATATTEAKAGEQPPSEEEEKERPVEEKPEELPTNTCGSGCATRAISRRAPPHDHHLRRRRDQGGDRQAQGRDVHHGTGVPVRQGTLDARQGAGLVQEHKPKDGELELEEKVGRVMAERNRKRLRQIYHLLREMEEDGGFPWITRRNPRRG